MVKVQQKKHPEWHYQWQHHKDDVEFLFFDWIFPYTLEDFRDMRVLDAGCGPGHHTRIVSPVAKSVTALDLNTAELAGSKLSEFDNVHIVEADLALYKTGDRFDMIYCIGMIHHTDSPEKTFENLTKLCQPDGVILVWCYSEEGNTLVRYIVEPLRKIFLRNRSRKFIDTLSTLLTASMYPIVHTLYRLPLPFLPFYEYFENFRNLSFKRNVLNVFDKLNAPQTDFISRKRIENWFNENDFYDVRIEAYKGVSWRASGRLKDKSNV